MLGISLVGIFFLISVYARVSMYLATRRMHAVITALSKLEIDKTSEEELARVVPYLQRSPWNGQISRSPETGNIDLGEARYYYAQFSNEKIWMKYFEILSALRFCSAGARVTKEGYEEGCFSFVSDVLGYRYFAFGASVTLLNGKISSIRYGINDRLVFPSQLGAIVSIRSFHSIWRAHQTGFVVDSVADESPQFRVSTSERTLWLEYAYDARPEMIKHAFQIDLSCFWSLGGCRNAQQIAPQLWKDGEAIESAALARLKSREPCPNGILAGRIRYLPDAGITLAESKGLRRIPVNIEGDEVVETVTDFKLVELLRAPRVGSLTAVRGRPRVSYSDDSKKQVLNGGNQWLWPEAGKQIFFFSNMYFASCQVVPATPDAISAMRTLAPAPRREEDQTGMSLQ
jgi:hypothetical protein